MVSQQNTSGVVIGEIRQLDLLKKENESINDNLRIEQQEKAYYYYAGDSNEIKGYLEEAITQVFGDKIVKGNEWLYEWLNVTEKLINRQAVIYKEPAARYIIGKDGKEDETLTEYYNKIIPPDVNSKNKKAHRFSKLFNTSLTQVTFNKESGKIDYVIEPSFKLKVIPDENDYLKISELVYLKEFKNERGINEVFEVVWNKNEHYKRDASGKKYPIKDSGMGNPFEENGEGVIPFAILRISEGEDFWGIGAEDIINMNSIVNFLLTFLLNNGIILGSSGTLLGINLGLNNRGTINDDTGEREVRFGIRHPITVDNVRDGEAPPSLQYISTQPLITEIQNSIDYRIKQIAVLKGLNPNTILSTIKDTSDYQKMMDSLEQIEVRRDDIEPCRNYEKELFKITRIVNNTAAQDSVLKSKFNLQEIPEDVEIKVDFAEIVIEKTNEELWQDREKRLALNLTTPIEILIEENPDLSENEAKKILEDNRLINMTIGSNKQPSIVETLLGNNSIKKEKVND